nr:MAG TPA: hypothetical protein [Caudoviricetes sp.]DAU02134.1 MAG TPA: hypothetical protein [Caudoviricetes sp.]
MAIFFCEKIIILKKTRCWLVIQSFLLWLFQSL